MQEVEQQKPDYRSFSPRSLPKIGDCKGSVSWIVDDFVQEGTVTMVSGESSGGKSTVCLHLAQCISLGEPFLNKKTRKTPVLIVDRENGISIYKTRFERLGMSDNENLMIWGAWADLFPPGPDNIALRHFVDDEKPVIIFDSFLSLHPGSEQDASETRKYMDNYRLLANNGATVILIHHTGKSENSKKYRGSSDIMASVDAGWLLTMKKARLKHLMLTAWKFREGEVDPYSFGLTDDGFDLVDPIFINEDNQHWKTIADIIKSNPGLKQSEIAKRVPEISPATVNRALMWMDNKHKLIIEDGPGRSHLYRWAPETAHDDHVS